MRLVGHRGARFEAPENTLSGFRYALGIGVDAFEFDVHLSRDNELVIIHDATVDRTTNGTGEVSSFTLAELRALDARSNFPDWPEPCAIPTYADVLDLIGDKSWLETEIKTDTPERLDIVLPKVIDTIRGFGIAANIIITSFDVYALELAQRLAPEIRRGYICKWNEDAHRKTAERLEISLAGFPYATGDPELVAWAKSAGILVTGWPTNTPEALDTALEWGTDAICTDAPSAMRELLAARG